MAGASTCMQTICHKNGVHLLSLLLPLSHTRPPDPTQSSPEQVLAPYTVMRIAIP